MYPGIARENKYGVIKDLDTASNQSAGTGAREHPITTSAGTTIFQAGHYFTTRVARFASRYVHWPGCPSLACCDKPTCDAWRNS